MNAVEIEEAVSALAERPFDPEEFLFAFLEAFGNKETTLKRLRRGESNKSDLGGVLQTNNIHIAVAAPGEVTKTLSALKASPATTSGGSIGCAGVSTARGILDKSPLPVLRQRSSSFACPRLSARRSIKPNGTESEADPSNVRIFLVDILKFDGFFDAKFHILKPRWLPTTSPLPSLRHISWAAT